MSIDSASPQTHAFLRAPNRTILTLSLPVLISLIAEPLTGLVDTAFVARLGAESLAALGVGTAALSSIFWIFNFLGVGSQTEVAQALGAQRHGRASRVAGLAFLLGSSFGLLLILLGWPSAYAISGLLGASGEVQESATLYMRVRLFGAPAVVSLLAAFGVLRGLQDMKTPLWIALTINVINIALDASLLWAGGRFRASALPARLRPASCPVDRRDWAVSVVVRRLGWPAGLRMSEATGLIRIGGDLFVRTGMLTLFILLSTRVATQSGAQSGAANQAIRQFWSFAAFRPGCAGHHGAEPGWLLHRLGHGGPGQTRGCGRWSLGIGPGYCAGVGHVDRAWLDCGVAGAGHALAPFYPAWLLAAISQPINALAFVTDGIHWGTGDFRYLRNVVTLATAVGAAGLFLIDTTSPNALAWVWAVTIVWISIRAGFGVLRVWPGIGNSPFRGSEKEVKMHANEEPAG
jgi:MATE family multidrug resistance protein